MSDRRAELVAKQLWRDPNDLVYAIVDAARDPRIHPGVVASPDTSACLYSANPTSAMATVAPYLVALDPKAPFTRQLLSVGWGDAWGIFVRTPVEIERVRRHFKRFLRARTEDGQTVVFRYYDPRVLRVYLPTCTEDELLQLFGFATDIVMEGETPDQLLAFSRRRSGFACTRLDLAAEPVAAELVDDDPSALGRTHVTA